MTSAAITPPLLGPGARVALVAPAGPLQGNEDLDRAVANALAMGWDPVIGDAVLARHGYLAGPDEARAADLARAIADRRIDGIWCIRGGYGAMRILELVDFAPLAARPKAVIGYSDITALHAAIGRAGVVSFHGPTARGELTPFSRDSLAAATVLGTEPAGSAPEGETLCEGVARGRLAGGNLALLAALAGTPFFPDLGGAILVLEDVGEANYRLDRLLRQLRLAGSLRGVAGLIFGAFTERGEEADALPLATVLGETAAALGVPCMAGAPVGHIPDQWTLPLGAEATLDAGARRLTIDTMNT